MSIFDDLIKNVQAVQRKAQPNPLTPSPGRTTLIPEQKPSAFAASSTPSIRNAPPLPRDAGGFRSQLGNMSGWDMFNYGQSEAGQKRFAADNTPEKVAEREAIADVWASAGSTKPANGGGYMGGGMITPDQAQMAGVVAREQQGYPLAGGILGEAKINRERTAQEKYQSPFTQLNNRTEVRELTLEEWALMSDVQQKAVVANYALYQAGVADKALPADIERAEGYDALVAERFSETGGSDTYAPNTLRVLEELGYSNADSDLDLFLNGSAILGEGEIDGTSTLSGRMSIMDELTGSSAWQNSNLVPALESGAALIDALKQTDAFSNDTLSQAGIQPLAYMELDVDTDAALSELMGYMGDRSIYNSFTEDQESNDSFQEYYNQITSGLDPALVARYFRENYAGDGVNFMSPDEFYATWLN